MKTIALISAAALLVSLVGCSSEPPAPQKKAEEKPPEPVTGRVALNKMYVAARGWAADIQPLKVTSILLPEVKAAPKSPRMAGDLRLRQPGQGQELHLFRGGIGRQSASGRVRRTGSKWSGPSGAAKPFIMAAIKIDSDQAYEAAMKKGAEYDKKNPGKPINFLLEANDKFPDVSWRVISGRIGRHQQLLNLRRREHRLVSGNYP